MKIPFTQKGGKIVLLNIPDLLGKRIPIWAKTLDYLIKYSWHHRLRVFYYKGVSCVECGLQGIILIKTKDKSGIEHVDLYSEDFQLMTVDHIIPRSKGGKNGFYNLQPMCSICNSKKGNFVVR